MTRKASLLAVLLVLSLFSSAQFNKGIWFIGGNLGSAFFNSDKQNVTFPSPTLGYEYQQTQFNIMLRPFLGKFISPRTAVGGGLLLNISTTTTSFKSPNGNTFRKDEVNTSDAGLSLFARTYFSPGENPLNAYAQLGISGGSSSIKSNGFIYASNYKETYDGKSSGGFYFTPELGVGISKKVSERVALEFGFLSQYRFSKYDMKTTTLHDDNVDGTIDVTLISEPSYDQKKTSFLFNLGFVYFFENLMSAHKKK